MGIDWSFLTKDMDRQRQLAQEALDEAKRIDEILKSMPEGDARVELEKTRAKFLDLARSLAKNVTITSDAANTSLSVVTSRW